MLFLILSLSLFLVLRFHTCFFIQQKKHKHTQKPVIHEKTIINVLAKSTASSSESSSLESIVDESLDPLQLTLTP